MSLSADPRYFPQPDVPTGDYSGNFGREMLYYGYAPRNSAIDAANAAAGEKTYSSGKYTFDPATGQYTWAPVKPIAATTGAGLSAAGGYDGGPGGGQDFGGGAGVGEGFPGSTLVDGVSGPTTGMASTMNAAAAGIGNFGNRLGGVYGAGLRGLSDAIAKNVDPNYSHEGRAAQRSADVDSAAALSDAMSNAISGADGGGGYSGGADAPGANSDGFGGGDAGFGGGSQAFAQGGGISTLGGYSDGGRLLRGPGDGVSDSIPATIGKAKQPARLADGEFVVPARIVSELGNGSTEAGARKLYAMLARIQAGRKKSIGKSKVAVNSRMDKYLPA